MGKKPMRRKTSVSLAPSTITKLKRIAKKRQRSVSFLVNEGIEQLFQQPTPNGQAKPIKEPAHA